MIGSDRRERSVCSLDLSTQKELDLESYPAIRENYFEFYLPGCGEKPFSCRSWLPSWFCPSCGKPHLVKGDCKTAGCPDCKDDWRYLASKRIMKHILSYEFDKKDSDIKRTKRVRHFALSPPSKDYPSMFNTFLASNSRKMVNYEELKELFDYAYDFVKNKGVEGGFILLHLFRLKEDKKNELKAIAKQKDGWFKGEFSLWKTLQNLNGWQGYNWQDFVYYSPHFHVLAVCDSDKKFDAGNSSDNWVWEGLGEVSDSNDLGRCVMYLLSHAGLVDKKHFSSYRYFGNLSCSKHSFDGDKTGVDSEIQRFVKSLIKGFNKYYSDDGFEGLECTECGEKLLHITALDKDADYWADFSEFQKKRLDRAKKYFLGRTTPPPGIENKKEIDSWLNFDLEDDLRSYLKFLRKRFAEIEDLGGEKFEG